MISTRSSTVNSACFPGLMRMAMVTSSNTDRPRAMMSRWPLVMGSNEPGKDRQRSPPCVLQSRLLGLAAVERQAVVAHPDRACRHEATPFSPGARVCGSARPRSPRPRPGRLRPGAASTRTGRTRRAGRGRRRRTARPDRAGRPGRCARPGEARRPRPLRRACARFARTASTAARLVVDENDAPRAARQRPRGPTPPLPANASRNRPSGITGGQDVEQGLPHAGAGGPRRVARAGP